MSAARLGNALAGLRRPIMRVDGGRFVRRRFACCGILIGCFNAEAGEQLMS